MPHRVANFFRSSNDSLHNNNHKSTRRTSPSARVLTGPTEGIIRRISYSSSTDESDDHSHTSHSAAPAVKAPGHHRLSLGGLHLGHKHKVAKDPSQNEYASLQWKIESPPAVMYGTAEESTGALVSGQLLLAAKEADLEIESFDAVLNIHVTQKRPFQAHCDKCADQKTELQRWTFLSEPTTLSAARTHNFPFSSLLEGHLPATTDNTLVSIRYEFSAEVKFRGGVKTPLLLEKTILVKRALPVPELPHHSIRIFPPTNIKASVHYPQVIHPIGANTLSLRLDGIVKHNSDTKTVEYWKLKRLTWKLEETITTVAPACEKHAPKLTEEEEAAATPAKKGSKRTAERTIGHMDMHSGWKADYTPDGTVECEIEFQCQNLTKPNCDLKARDGTQITHQLVVEMVVVQEYAPTNQPKHVTPTGVARILRMHFNVNLTERSGLGVSWDNEAPPIYQDVPASPPAYACNITNENIQDLVLGSAPVYTEGSYAGSYASSAASSSRPSSIAS